MITLDDLISTADSCLHELPDGAQKDNALYCVREAAHCYEQGDGACAQYWALRSLKHSIGILHPTYRAYLQELPLSA